jgi:hypothetical protein
MFLIKRRKNKKLIFYGSGEDCETESRIKNGLFSKQKTI